jgi:hypothetical protein
MITRTLYSYTNEVRSAWWPDLRRSNHVYIVGPSGSGKSTAMVNLCHRIACGEYGNQGFAFLDPHGDTAWEDILNNIPRERLEQTIWFDPTDQARPFGINLVPYAPDNPLAAEHTLEALASIWKLDQETERLVKHILIVHSYLPDSTLFDCIKMLNNSQYRTAIVEKCGNSLTRLFWQTEFPLWEMTPRFRADRVGPVLSMFETLLQHPALQRIFGQPQSTIDFRQVMDSGQIMVCSLARGALGDQASRLLGAILLSKFRGAAYSRVGERPEARRPFTLFVDEFHELTEGEAGGRVLQGLFSGGRKYGLGLVVAHQGDYQDPLTVKAAIANAHTKVCFAVNTEDLEREFRTQEFQEVDFDSKPVWVKEGADVFYGEPIGKLLPTLEERLTQYARREHIVALSQERFGSAGEKVGKRVKTLRW